MKRNWKPINPAEEKEFDFDRNQPFEKPKLPRRKKLLTIRSTLRYDEVTPTRQPKRKAS